MKYIIWDIDGTLADSSHRFHLLPAYVGKTVTRADTGQRPDDGRVPSGTVGTVIAREDLPSSEESMITVEWDDQPAPIQYCWSDFMHATGGEWKSWHHGMIGDKLISHTAFVLQAMRPALLASNIGILFLTARWESYREDTLTWLQAKGLTLPGFNDVLEMRQVGDERKDTAFKGDVIARYLKGGHTIEFAFEDRTGVAQMMRERGIPVFHVDASE